MEANFPLFQASEVLKWSLNSDKFSSILSNCKLKLTQTYSSDHILIYDLKLDVRGYEEDEIYLKNLVLRTNIKRGNSLMLIGRFSDFKHDSDLRELKPENIEKFCWVRRGLTKFFDVSIESLNQVLSFSNHIKQSSGKVLKTKKDCHKVTFEQIELHLSQGFTIDVYQTEKANGENVQISYIKLLEKWIISSKNCSIVVANSEEIEKFHNDRYKFTKIIASKWFVILDNVRNVCNLKEYLNGRTMVGEYIGNPLFKHIVSYTSEEIRFFSITENFSSNSCLPVLESFYRFKIFNLPRVQVRKVGRFLERFELYKQLKTLFKEISSQSLENSGEGSVLYFVANRGDASEIAENDFFSGTEEILPFELVERTVVNQVTISLGKIKTVEYRIYRKIREKLKNLKKGSGSLQSSIEKFTKDIKNLIDENSSIKNSEFYLNEFIKTAEKVLGPKKVNQVINETQSFDEEENKSESLLFLETSPLYEIDPTDLSESLGLFYDNKKDCHKFLAGHVYHNIIKNNNFPVISSAIYVFAGFSLKSEQKFKNLMKNNLNDQAKKTKSKKKSKKSADIDDSFKTIRRIIENSPSDVMITHLDPPDETSLIKELKSLLKTQQKHSLKTRSSKLSSVIFIPCFLPFFNQTSLLSTLSSAIVQVDPSFKTININDLIQPSSQTTPGTNNEILSVIQELQSKNSLIKTEKRKPQVFLIDHCFTPRDLQSFIEMLQVLRTDSRIVGIFLDSCGYNLKKGQSFKLSEVFFLSCLKNIIKNQTFENQIQENIHLLVQFFKEFTAQYEKSIQSKLDAFIRIKFFDENWKVDQKFSDIVRSLVQKEISQELLLELVEDLEVLEIPEVDDSSILAERVRKCLI